jgi:hypothetical protein
MRSTLTLSVWQSLWLLAIALNLTSMMRAGASISGILFAAGDAAAAAHVSEIYPTNDGVVGVCGGLTALKQAQGIWNTTNPVKK